MNIPSPECRSAVASGSKRRAFSCCSRIAVLLLLFNCGCSTHFDRLQPIRTAFFDGNLPMAQEALAKELKKRKGEQDVLMLDQAVIELASGRPKDAERILRQVRDRFDELEGIDAGKEVASMLTDDQVRPYAGEDYEKVLIRAMLSLSNLMSGGGDAGAYALQMVDKQQQIMLAVEEKYKEEDQSAVLAYKQVALGPYIRGMLAEESPLTLNDALRARVQVAKWEPNFRDAKVDIHRCEHEVAMHSGHGALYVFALVGRGPIKQETAEVPTQAALLVADRIFDALGKRNVTPTLAPVKIPRVINFVPVADCVSVQINGEMAGKTATLVDIGEMAVQQQQAHFPAIIGRAVARRVIKKGILYGAQEMADVQKGSLLSLGVLAAGVAWEATESADTRCWGLLPDTIQVFRVELPVGEHTITLRPSQRQGDFGTPAQTKVTIREGRHTYLLGNLPASRFVGELLTSSREYDEE
ncbi:COG3014 family protein [Schlesneria sp. DSM 10557]|uniref:COG3014 family protein n=1 Tax=Schlesneria sp. DSM 10557 TaxID=3044399 RepID=UPI00359F991D